MLALWEKIKMLSVRWTAALHRIGLPVVPAQRGRQGRDLAVSDFPNTGALLGGDMSYQFKRAFDFAMQWEGYKSSDSADPGGRTIFGISERSHPSVVVELWDLPKEEAYKKAEGFYKKEYWLKAGCDKQLFPFDMVLFDTAVNLGISKAKQLMRGANSAEDLILARVEFYAKISTGVKIKYLRGWINRATALWRFIK